MNWLGKRVKMRPLVVLAVIVGFLLAGSGVALAVTVTELTEEDLWPGHASIVTDTELSVDSYELIYTEDLTQVDKVQVTVANSNATTDIGVNVEVAAGKTGTWGTGSNTGTAIQDTTTMIEVDLTPDVALGDLDDLNIMVTRT